MKQKFSILKSELGFSIVELLIVSGLSGVVALGMASLMKNVSTSQKQMESKSDYELVLGQITTTLSNKTACINTFKVFDGSAASWNSAKSTGLSVTQVLNRTNATVYSTIDGSSQLGSVGVKELTLLSYDSVNESAILRVKGKFNLNGKAVDTKTRDIPLNFVVNQATNNIISCSVISGTDLGPWKMMALPSTGIFYDEGSVSVGTNVVTDGNSFVVGASNSASGIRNFLLGQSISSSSNRSFMVGENHTSTNAVSNVMTLGWNPISPMHSGTTLISDGVNVAGRPTLTSDTTNQFKAIFGNGYTFNTMYLTMPFAPAVTVVKSFKILPDGGLSSSLGFATGNSIALSTGDERAQGIAEATNSSLAIGTALASGNRSIAIGLSGHGNAEQTRTSARGTDSIAICAGADCDARGTSSVAFGTGAFAGTHYGYAFGREAVSTGINAYALGYQAYAYGDRALTLGRGLAYGPNTIVLGNTPWTQATGSHSIAIGGGKAIAANSIVVSPGIEVGTATANAQDSIIIGKGISNHQGSTIVSTLSAGATPATTEDRQLLLNSDSGGVKIKGGTYTEMQGSTYAKIQSPGYVMLHYTGTFPSSCSLNQNGFSCTGSGGTCRLGGVAGPYCTSDRNVKIDRGEVDLNENLKKIRQLPIHEWSFKSDVTREIHLGPFAQDFNKIFPYHGKDKKEISINDVSTVALAGVKQLDIEISELKDQNKKLLQELKVLKEYVERLQKTR